MSLNQKWKIMKKNRVKQAKFMKKMFKNFQKVKLKKLLQEIF